MFFKICVQFIGFIGAAFGFIAYQNNNHKKIMLFKTASELTFALQFVLLRAYTGVAMNLIGCARNLVFACLLYTSFLPALPPPVGRNSLFFPFFITLLFSA